HTASSQAPRLASNLLEFVSRSTRPQPIRLGVRHLADPWWSPMKLIIQPDDGIAPVVTGIKHAKRSIDILIFRLDRYEIARALEQAVARGVHVRALTAHQNRGGTKTLRKLEMQLLESGVTVS